MYRRWDLHEGERKYRPLRNYILRTYRGLGDRELLESGEAVKPPYPTESEFAEFIVDAFDSNRHHVDSHWKPQWANCPFCSHDFDVIGKLETFDEDRDYVFRKLGFSSDVLDKAQATHDHDNKNRLGGGKTRKFISQISSVQLKKLVECYQRDFIMFGYDMEDYKN